MQRGRIVHDGDRDSVLQALRVNADPRGGEPRAQERTVTA
jgi:hypothetical protein